MRKKRLYRVVKMSTSESKNFDFPQDLHRFSSFVIHYGEIALKKGNRDLFEDSLMRNIRTAVDKKAACEIRRLQGRIHLEFAEPTNGCSMLGSLSRVFGVASISAAVRSEPSLEAIKQVAKNIIAGRVFESFAVRTRRAEKSFPVSSQKVNEEVGAMVQKISGAKVDLENPKLTVAVEITKKHAFVFLDHVKGPGGLPVGVSGKVACLISGGIDSPVAAWRAMKRGCLPVFVHFHSAPFTSAASQEKVVELVSHLMKGQPKTRLVTVPFGPIQQKIVVNVPTAYRIIIYRRFMVRIAERIAREHKAQALVTGEALSQVASQTLSNIATIEAASEMPILRPLIGMDKQEIVDEAKKIGTYDIAIVPHDDCCSFLMPRNPVTRTTIAEVEKVEQNLDIEALVQMGLDAKEIRDM